jgi:O-acetyl-ADP-ribose deacetylase (regulator of RNase III)
VAPSGVKVTIAYVRGDATKPSTYQAAVIVHICNDVGKWGKGFVTAVSRRWKQPEQRYRESFAAGRTPSLGDVQFVEVEPGVTVANLIGQHGVRSPRDKVKPPPIRYDAIRAGLDKVADYAVTNGASVHMPRIGCGLAGGNWSDIEPLIRQALTNRGVSTTVYDLE